MVEWHGICPCRLFVNDHWSHFAVADSASDIVREFILLSTQLMELRQQL
jgi:hypothetical protein